MCSCRTCLCCASPGSGQHVAACYFMWPIAFQDGHEFPAYVQREKLIELMVQMEAQADIQALCCLRWGLCGCTPPTFRHPSTDSPAFASAHCRRRAFQAAFRTSLTCTRSLPPRTERKRRFGKKARLTYDPHSSRIHLVHVAIFCRVVRTFVSSCEEWTAQMCLHPLLKVPHS